MCLTTCYVSMCLGGGVLTRELSYFIGMRSVIGLRW